MRGVGAFWFEVQTSAVVAVRISLFSRLSSIADDFFVCGEKKIQKGSWKNFSSTFKKGQKRDSIRIYLI